jgi:AraC-like DNA-binding protein
MTPMSQEPIDRAIVVCQLLYSALKLPSYMFDLAGNHIIEIPENLVNDCFCSRYSRALGTELNLDDAFKRFKDSCMMDTILTHCCPYGLSAITIPVKSVGELVAVISFGPILTKDPLEILNDRVYPQPGITESDGAALAEYLYSLHQYDSDFLSAFSQIISLALNKNSEVLCAPRMPISRSEWRQDEYKHHSHSEIVEEALHYMAENYTNDISLTDVADHVFVHPKYLSKLFNQYVSFGFRNYLNHLRISRARLMLLDPQTTINSICFEVGFSDQSYFNRVFKLIEGVTPGQFRNQHLPNNHEETTFTPKMEVPDKYRFLREEAMLNGLKR